MAISQILQNTISLYNGIKIVGSILTNPADATILADTGALSKDNYLFGFIIETSLAGEIVDIQHRNAANSANIDFIRIRISNAWTEYPIFPSKIPIALNERIRIVQSGAIVGEVQASIFYVRVY